MAVRQPRPKTVHFKPCALLDRWSGLLNLRSPGFAWDGSVNLKASRSASVDEERLLLHKKPLQGLLAVAPTGFPSFGHLRDTLVQAHDSYKIFDAPDRQVQKVAGEAADIWRITTKDVYNIKKNNIFISPELQELVDMVVLPTSARNSSNGSEFTSNSESPAAPTNTLTEAEMEDLFPQFPDPDLQPESNTDDSASVESIAESDDVTITKEICLCPVCVARREIVVAGAKSGQQRTETNMAAEKRRRLMVKTPQSLAPMEKTDIANNPTDMKTDIANNPTDMKTGFAKRGAPQLKNCIASDKVRMDSDILKPVTMIWSKIDGVDYALINQNKHGRKFLIGQTKKQHKDCGKNIENLSTFISDGAISTLREAREFLAKG